MAPGCRVWCRVAVFTELLQLQWVTSVQYINFFNMHTSDTNVARPAHEFIRRRLSFIH